MAPGGYAVAVSTEDHIVVQDDDPAIVYTPQKDWYKFGGDGGNYTVTNAYLAQFVYTFTGSEIWYYSDVNGDHGNFSVALDGVSKGIRTSSAPSWKPQIVLFHATLEPGTHTITVMSMNQLGNVTSLDYLAWAARSCVELLGDSPGGIADIGR
ncbi:hypothetical protein AURDEDRAFT_122970 [Auricularia subglabra TFB-10046 SS5]|nr:hypothetical protein AURDEDRAFT_122970 [Auricularia subglabra TFB-10046 SS5]